MATNMIPILYKERGLILLRSIHGDATLVSVDFSDNFLDSDGNKYIYVIYSLLLDKYDIHHFYGGYWLQNYIEGLLNEQPNT